MRTQQDEDERAGAAGLRSGLVSWHVVVPVLGIVQLLVSWRIDVGPALVTMAALLLAGSVFAAVHHAEIVAARIGEPFGSLVLAVAVTVIEVGLIVIMMTSASEESSSLARDTVFAAAMITTNGIVGVSLLVGSLRYGMTRFHPEGAGAALACVTTLAALTMVFPNFTVSEPGPEYAASQLVFAACASLLLYGLFVFTQTLRHRDFFLPVAGSVSGSAADGSGDTAPEPHTPRPGGLRALLSAGVLVLALVAVVGLAKVESPAIEAAVSAVGFPHSFVGVIIAVLVLLPETIAAVRAALRGHIQTSLNLGYGSAMASIGLTIPVIAGVSSWLPGPLVLGLGSTQLVLLTLTVVVSVLTVVPGRATRLQGGIHLIVLAAFLFLAVRP